MDVLIHLKSDLLGEALGQFLKNADMGGNTHVMGSGEKLAVQSPDLVLVDSVSLCRDLYEWWPAAKFLLIDTGLGQEELVSLFLHYRIDGVISTQTDLQLFRKALDVVAKGEIWLDNANIKALIHKAGTMVKRGVLENVSNKEKEIIGLISQGFKNKEIAAKLFLSEHTIKVHISRIFRKFNVTSRSQLVTLMMKSHEAP